MDGPRACHAVWSKSDRQGEILYGIPYMQNLKGNDANELIFKTDSQTRRTNSRWPEGRIGGGNSWGAGDGHIHTAIFKMDNQQWPTQRSLFNVVWQPGWEGSLGENRYVYVYGWVPLLFTRCYHNIVNRLYSSIKFNSLKKVFGNINTKHRNLERSLILVNVPLSSWRLECHSY